MSIFLHQRKKFKKRQERNQAKFIFVAPFTERIVMCFKIKSTKYIKEDRATLIWNPADEAI